MPAYNKSDPHTIQNMFNSIAKRYDLTNSVLSLQMHKRWNHELVRNMLFSHKAHTLLDLCCGTGDIAFDYLKTTPSNCHAYLVDFCSGMLACAKEKEGRLSLTKHTIDYIEADVQSLPLMDASVDCATMAYGIRNVKDPLRCIKEAYRVLKPGGRLGILELTQPNNSFLRLGHRLYLSTALPLLGKLITTNKEAYQYLCQSIQTFIAPAELEKMMFTSQFVHTSVKPLLGGIATILIGYKPA